jgi:hypothetical protein
MPTTPPVRRLRVGDRVRLVSIPEETLRGLSDADAAFVRSMVGRTMPVMGFDRNGQVELEFSTRELIFHTIWVPPACVRPRSGKPGPA